MRIGIRGTRIIRSFFAQSLGPYGARRHLRRSLFDPGGLWWDVGAKSAVLGAASAPMACQSTPPGVQDASWV